MANVPKNSEEWAEFSKGFADIESAVVLGAVGGNQFDVPLAAACGGYFPSVVCVAALIRNLADNTEIPVQEVMDDISEVLDTVTKDD